MNDVPGSERLGWGFNIFGPYADSSTTSLLFDLGTGNRTWRDAQTGFSYRLPDNVSVTGGDVQHPSTTAYKVFATRTDVQRFFAGKAGVEANLVSELGAFSGSFNAAFSTEMKSSDDYKYAIVESDIYLWGVRLQTESLDKLTKSVQADIASLPATYSKNQRGLFFTFFDNYGTHYVANVTVGGRLYYNVAIDKSYEQIADNRKIEVELKYEYLGLFGAKANASAEWRNITEGWRDTRRAQIQVVGGASQALGAVTPSFSENHEDVYRAWTNGVGKQPATVDFILRPIATLFPIVRQDVINRAYRDYLAVGIVTITATSVPYRLPLPSPKQSVPVVVLGGKQIAPSSDPRYSIGFMVVVMAPVDELGKAVTVIRMLNYYSMDLWGADQDYNEFFDEMARDIAAATDSPGQYNLIVASFNWNYFAPPSVQFQGVLRNAGAGAVLDEWLQKSQANAGSVAGGYDCTYCLVGQRGGPAAEAMDVSGGITAWQAFPITTKLRARIDKGGYVTQLNVG